jgi:hypothetical protein
MLKLVSNKNGDEIHHLEISENGFTIEPSFEGVQELLSGLADKQQILNALSGFNPEYVWAVTYETPPVKPLKRRQFMRVLALNGFDLNEIEAMILSIEDTQARQLAIIDWRDATDFERNDATLLQVAGLMQLDKAQIDELWSQALDL